MFLLVFCYFFFNVFMGFFLGTTPGPGCQVCPCPTRAAAAGGVPAPPLCSRLVPRSLPVSPRTELACPCPEAPRSPAILFPGTVPGHIEYLCPWNSHFLIYFFISCFPLSYSYRFLRELLSPPRTFQSNNSSCQLEASL